MEFRKFTNKKSNNTILSFIQPDNTVIFEENSKAIELEETFFKGKHLNINQFDENFYDEVMGEYITMTLSDDEGEEDYYNKEISMDELEGAVSRLKIDSAINGSIVLLLFLLVNFLNSIHLSFICLALLIFAQIFSDHFSSATSFASIYSSSALIRDDRLVGELLSLKVLILFRSCFFFPTSGFHQHGLLNFLPDFEIFGTAISIQFRKLSSNCWYICLKFWSSFNCTFEN
jgi:hypothetical protein